MNFNKFINSDYLKENPLCGVGTYKDELNLATGACTRKIKELVLTGEETGWNRVSSGGRSIFYLDTITPDYLRSNDITLVCTHYKAIAGVTGASDVGEGETALYKTVGVNQRLYFGDSNYSAVDDFKAYLAQQYANGTPVIVWYFLATAETETIPVPTGLSGTEEGYLIQDGTPTPTNPIYPTANTVEQWFDLNHYIMGTSTDTITTPADIYANDTTATVGLKGNMQQTGTPTPDNPIMPQGTGERTENRFDAATAYGAMYNNGSVTGELTALAAVKNAFTADMIGQQVTISVKATTIQSNRAYIRCSIGGSNIDSNSISQGNTGTMRVTVTPTSTSDRWWFTYGSGSGSNTFSELMLNEGSTAKPFEPWGNKIPISSASTTTPVYLGEVETTRKIIKLVLTGEEDITSTHLNVGLFNIPVSGYLRLLNQVTCICTHYIGAANAGGWSAVSDKTACFYAYTGASEILYIRDSTYNTIDAFKAYLAQQYAAGTPVTVWYVLAESTTGIVNEPIRKIGTYADEVSGITIPVTAGANTLSVDTTLQPSEVTVNYKGWHPVTSAHERESGQWD